MQLEITLACDLSRSLVTVHWPGGQRWAYRIRETGPEYLAYRSDPIEGWHPDEPNLLAAITDEWVKTVRGTGSTLRWTYADKVDAEGLPLPTLSDQERMLIWALMGMDADRDGVVMASVEQVDKRIREMGKRL